MKKFVRYCSAVICFGAALLFSSTCFAQTTYPFIAVGSSAAFNAFAIAGASNGTAPICVNSYTGNLSSASNVYYWTQSSSAHSLQAVDGRSTDFSAQNAKAWVEWSGSLDGTTVNAVCVYLATDSIVGQRLYFATNSAGTPASSINFPGGCGSSYPVGGQIPAGIFPPESPLPPGVCSKLQGQLWNAAPSDIRAEDAAFGTTRACATYAATGTGFGYSCILPSPTSIYSGIGGSSGNVQAVTYAIAGTDPITNVQIAHSAAGTDGHPWTSINAGGQAVLVLVNTADTSAEGFGSTTFSNVNRPDLARVFTGGATRTRDLIQAAGLSSKPLTALVREPLSGTFNTFEFQVARTKEYDFTQEGLTNLAGVISANGIGMATPTGWTFEGLSCPAVDCPSAVTGNPLDWKRSGTSGSGGLKVRVIGTGEMVNTLTGLTTKCNSQACQDRAGNLITNQIGYTFFSFGNVAPAVGTAKYLLVDGVDPLFDGAAGPTQNPGGEGSGALPTCSAPCPSAVTLTNIKNGSYPLWNILRVITSGQLGAVNTAGSCLTGATVCEMVAASQAAYSTIPDLVAQSNMRVFRSHQTIMDGGKTFAGHNGTKHYSGVTGTPCGFAAYTGGAIVYECGGDVSGARFTIQQDADQITDTAAELVGLQQ